MVKNANGIDNRGKNQGMPLEERFWLYVDKKGDSECWNWVGSVKHGYGNLHNDKRNIGSHKLSYILHRGKVPEGKEVCHRCNNRACVNPNHLYVGTHKQNMQQVTADKRWLRMDHRGEKNNSAKIKATDVPIIRKLYSMGKYKKKQLAHLYNISISQIGRIINKRAWNY